MIFIIALIIAAACLLLYGAYLQSQEQVVTDSTLRRQVQADNTQIAKDKTEEETAKAKEKNAQKHAEVEEKRLEAEKSEAEARKVNADNAAAEGIDAETRREAFLIREQSNAAITQRIAEMMINVEEQLRLGRVDQQLAEEDEKGQTLLQRWQQKQLAKANKKANQKKQQKKKKEAANE